MSLPRPTPARGAAKRNEPEKRREPMPKAPLLARANVPRSAAWTASHLPGRAQGEKNKDDYQERDVCRDALVQPKADECPRSKTAILSAPVIHDRHGSCARVGLSVKKNRMGNPFRVRVTRL